MGFLGNRQMTAAKLPGTTKAGKRNICAGSTGSSIDRREGEGRRQKGKT